MKTRKGNGKRKPKKSILLVTNGEKTETLYLSGLKSYLRCKTVSLKVKTIPGSPSTVLKNLSSPRGDVSAYDEIWIVVDEDGEDRTSFINECRRRTNKQQKWVAVISRPCFEVWLIAHYKQVLRYSDQNEAVKHFRRIIPQKIPRKALPEPFPYSTSKKACTRCQLKGETLGDENALPPFPGTAMPHLIYALDSLCGFPKER